MHVLMGKSIENQCEMDHIDWAHYRMVGYAWVYDKYVIRIFEKIKFQLYITVS